MSFWGVDSYNPASHPVYVPHRYLRRGERDGLREPLFDYVMRRADRMPSFWGRYINQARGNRLHPGEADYIFERSGGTCRVLVVFNDVDGRDGALMSQGHGGGVDAARAAIAAARRHSVPFSARIFLDLEGWQVRPDYLEGWWDGMADGPYRGSGGIYGRGAEVRLSRRGFLPSTNPRYRPHSSNWARSALGAESSAVTRGWPSLISNLAQGRPGQDRSCHIWSNTPRRSGEITNARDILPPVFGGMGPVGALTMQTVVWQFWLNTFFPASASRGAVDLNLATKRGWNDMWSAGM